MAALQPPDSRRRRDWAVRGGLAGLLPTAGGGAAAGAEPRVTVPPEVVLGTCCLRGEESVQQVATGLEVGYRWIDTASHYENEECVASALQRVGVPRGEVFLVTKVWFDDMGEAAAAAIRRSLERLGTDYVDLLLVHFPGTNDAVQNPDANRRLRAETWRALEAAHASGAARAIGVSNFTRRHLKELLGYCRVAPAVNQLEVHPYFQQTELLDYCRSKGVQPMASSPLAHGELRLLENPALLRIASAHGRTPAQVVLRWLLQLGIPPVAFSASRQRLEENRGATGFALTDAEMTKISFLDKIGGRVGFDPNLIA